MRSKKEYLAKMRWRYGHAQGRWYKSRLIEELVAVCGYSRKHAISLLNGANNASGIEAQGAKTLIRRACARGTQADLVCQ